MKGRRAGIGAVLLLASGCGTVHRSAELPVRTIAPASTITIAPASTTTASTAAAVAPTSTSAAPDAFVFARVWLPEPDPNITQIHVTITDAGQTIYDAPNQGLSFSDVYPITPGTPVVLTVTELRMVSAAEEVTVDCELVVNGVTGPVQSATLSNGTGSGTLTCAG